MKKALVFVVFGVAAAQANIVANGGFELVTMPLSGVAHLDLPNGSTDLPSWMVYSTVAGSTFPVSVFQSPFAGLTPSEGSHWIDLTGTDDSIHGQYGGLQQSLSVEVGRTYLVTFDVGVCNFAACAGGTDVGPPVSVFARAGATSFTATNTNTASGNQWMTYQFFFTATEATTLLSFEGSNNTQANRWYIGLDNVAVEVVVPEPASFVLFGIGVAGLLAFARKRAGSR